MNEQISKIINHPNRNHVLIGMGVFVAGGISGYILGRRNSNRVIGVYEVPNNQLVFDYDSIENYNDTVQDLGYISSDSRPGPPGPVIVDAEDYVNRGEAFVIQKVEETTTVETTIDVETDEEEVELVTVSVFSYEDTWDQAAEEATRTPTQPYVIHRDEFFGEENDYVQHTYNYYAGDDILADDQDSPVYSYVRVVGPLKFGHGSGDQKVFYVRNEKRKQEYEIVLNEGLFSVEVEGLEIEENARARDLKHSSRPGRFQMD